MKIDNFIKDSKIFEALRNSKYFKKMNSMQLKSGRFTDLPRFTKIQNYLLESLYSISDMHNPSAFRVYLYLIRQITGYRNKSWIEYQPKKMKAQMNMGTSFYRAIALLQKKNMVYLHDRNGLKYIGLNPYSDTWITDGKERLNEIVENEANQILGKSELALVSSSSSSRSSSSSSSNSYPSNEDYIFKILDSM